MSVIDAAHPALLNPVAQQKSSDDCCCGGGGPITATVNIKKTGFLVSEPIIGSIQIVNQSSTTVRTLSCRLIQHATHRTHDQYGKMDFICSYA